jgi:hypothetical protein
VASAARRRITTSMSPLQLSCLAAQHPVLGRAGWCSTGVA